jgi:hypothetical protein
MTDDKVRKPFTEVTSIMSVLSDDAEHIVTDAVTAASTEAEEETRKFLCEYEQKIKQIMIKVREGSLAQVSEITDRFREAMLLRIEEASITALNGTAEEAVIKTVGIVEKLQKNARHEVKLALADNLMANETDVRSKENTPENGGRVEKPAELDILTTSQSAALNQGKAGEAHAGLQAEQTVGSGSNQASIGMNNKSAPLDQDFEQWLVS